MAYRVIFGNISYDGPTAGAFMHFVDTTTNQDVFPIQIDLTAAQMVDAATTRASIISATIAWAATQSVTISASDIVFPYDVATPPVAVINSATHSIVTGTGATGFQVSATRNAFVNYNTTIASTASISGNASGVLVLEVAPTNSATAGDWVEISRFTNAQALSLAITLQSVQTLSSPLSGMIPAGYYAKIRSITTGTVTYTYNSGREILQ